MRVFITGASSGIGEALARHYASKGATLGLAARRRDRLFELIEALPGEHVAYPLDVADEAARRFARAIERGTSYTVIPWQMGVVAKLMRLLPNPVFDAIFARGGRKPRGLDL